MTEADLERVIQKRMKVLNPVISMTSLRRVEMDPITDLGRAIDQDQILGQILDTRLEITLNLSATIPDRIADHQNMIKIIDRGMTNKESHQIRMENMTIKTRERTMTKIRTSIALKTTEEARLIINPTAL